MKIYNNPTYTSRNSTMNATSFAFKGNLTIKTRTFSNKDLQKEIKNKLLNIQQVQKFLEKYDVRLLFKTKTTNDSLYGKHYISRFKVKKKPVKGDFLTNIRRVFFPYSTIYQSFYESGECKTSVEKHLIENVLKDFDNFIDAMEKT